ncbi:hypothetical protein BG005_009417 [Podila minutissima]|nr:hypothetical protein BG005_009417 [Podila minutissima]
MALPSHFVDLLLILRIAFVFLALSTGLVHAQTPFTPVSSGDSASVFIEGKALYIQGGTILQNATNQTFSISLQYSWNISNPIYTKLPDGLQDSLFPNVLLLDGTTWFAISNKTFVTYDILTGNITQRGPANIYSNFVGLSAVLDRSLGDVVIPNGYTNGARPTTLYINPGNLSVRVNSLPDFPDLARYTLAWSESSQKAFLFGGSAGNTLSGILYQRNSSNSFGGWIPIVTTPELGGPTPRQSACMVPAFNGTKLIVFGGFGMSGTVLWNTGLSDIYIYDVAKASWTRGFDAGAARARAAHACAVSGDALVVWGGFTDLTLKQPPDSVIAVYNLTTKQWVDKFISPNGEQPPAISTPRPTTTAGSGSDSGPTPTPETSGSGNNTGAIIGGVAAAAILLATLGVVLWRRGLLKKRGIIPKSHHQQSDHRQTDGDYQYKEPAEKIRDPHIDPFAQSLPQPVSRSARGARHPQLVMSQHERDFAAQLQLENSARHPQFDIPQRGPEYDTEMQHVNGTRHPQFDTPQHEHGHYQQYQQNHEGLYDYRDPVWNNRDPHGDFNTQPISQSVPRPANGIRHPQLDIARRKQELAAEMQMLEYGSGEAPTFVQHTDGRSSNRSGGSPYP